MAEITDRIKSLQDKIVECSANLRIITQAFDQLKTKSQQDILAKDNELKEFEKKLVAIQTERGEIRKELDNKLVELENSNLSASEKHQQILQLLNENKDLTETVRSSFIQVWNNYESSRNKIIDFLEAKEEGCRDHIARLENRVIFLSITLLLLIIFLIYYIYRIKKHAKKSPSK